MSASTPKIPIAAVASVYRPRSHADVFFGKILEGYDQAGGPGPGVRIAAMYTDQAPHHDMSRALAARHGFPIVPSIDEAITLGGDRIQVAGVASICEHGEYPWNAVGQHEYPRRRFFEDIIATFRRCGQVAPVFNDKHLAGPWQDQKFMYDTAREMGIPFMAGSSLPLTYRVPELELPLGCEIEEALAIGYGNFESYGFHTLETLQCMVERRRGGETGVASVAGAKRDGIFAAERAGRWSRQLLDAALAAMPCRAAGPLEQLVDRDDAGFYFVNYRDGLRGSVAILNGITNAFGFAAKLRGRRTPVAAWFWLDTDMPFYTFRFLVDVVEQFFRSGKPLYPVERTLLSGGILDAALRSLAAGGAEIDTPHLAIGYEPGTYSFARGQRIGAERRAAAVWTPTAKPAGVSA